MQLRDAEGAQSSLFLLRLGTQHWGMNRKGEKYQKPKQVLNNIYWNICLEEEVIPGSKASMPV